MHFDTFQQRVVTWARKNFKTSDMGYHALLGVGEEVGELMHAHLKQVQGIRGSVEEHDAKGQDAVGDILVYLADYCDQRGWDMNQIALDTITLVEKRDWKANPTNGKTA